MCKAARVFRGEAGLKLSHPCPSRLHAQARGCRRPGHERLVLSFPVIGLDARHLLSRTLRLAGRGPRGFSIFCDTRVTGPFYIKPGSLCNHVTEVCVLARPVTLQCFLFSVSLQGRALLFGKRHSRIVNREFTFSGPSKDLVSLETDFVFGQRLKIPPCVFLQLDIAINGQVGKSKPWTCL